MKNLSFMLYQDPGFQQLGRIKKAVLEKDSLRANALHVWHIHGEDRVAKWLAQGAFRNWKNDDLVMVRALDTICGALIEIQAVLDDRTTLVRDLLRPDEPPFVLIDASTAAMACRFDVFLTWVYTLPGGLHRLSGVAQMVHDFGTMSHSEAFAILLKHLGAPDSGREKWILENMLRISQALAATKIARSARQYEISDLVACQRTCRIGGKGGTSDVRKITEFAAMLQQHPLVNDDGPGDPGPIFRASLLIAPASDDHPVECVGTVAIYPDGEIRLSSIGQQKSDSLLDFMKKFEPSFAVIGETLNDLGKQQIQKMGHWDPTLVPPALLENVSMMAMQTNRIAAGGDEDPMTTTLKSSFEGFADIPIPALDDRSPREAAAHPLLRPRLLDLMKRQVHMVDHQRRSNGVDFEINPLLDELGLVEIIQPPSPCGVRKSSEEDEDDDDLEMPPPQLPIQGQELDRRLKAAMATSFNSLADGSPIYRLLDAVGDLDSDFTAPEVKALKFSISLAHTLLHPHPPADYAPDPEGMIIRFDDYASDLMALETDQDFVDFVTRVSADTRQMDIVAMGVTSFKNLVNSPVEGTRIREEMRALMTIAYCAALCEITLWPPSRH